MNFKHALLYCIFKAPLKKYQVKSYHHHEVKLKNIAVVHQYKTTEIHSEVISSGILTAKEKRVLKKVVLGKIGKYAQVVVVFKYLL